MNLRSYFNSYQELLDHASGGQPYHMEVRYFATFGNSNYDSVCIKNFLDLKFKYSAKSVCDLNRILLYIRLIISIF